MQVWAKRLHAVEIAECAGKSFYILHRIADLDLKPEAAGVAAVIFGHSHQPSIEWRNGVLYFNPGSAGPRRFSLPVTVGKMRSSMVSCVRKSFRSCSMLPTPLSLPVSFS